MYNEVTLVGRIGNEPKVYREGTDNEVATTSVATSKNRKNQSGEWTEETQWHNIVGFGRSAAAVKRLGKGDLVVVKGELTYSEKDGTKYTNIVVIAAKRLSAAQNQAKPQQRMAEETTGDDLPF